MLEDNPYYNLYQPIAIMANEANVSGRPPFGITIFEWAKALVKFEHQNIIPAAHAAKAAEQAMGGIEVAHLFGSQAPANSQDIIANTSRSLFEIIKPLALAAGVRRNYSPESLDLRPPISNVILLNNKEIMTVIGSRILYGIHDPLIPLPMFVPFSVLENLLRGNGVEVWWTKA